MRFQVLLSVTIILAVSVGSLFNTAYAHGSPCQGGCFVWPNGTFWSFTDVVNIAGALAMVSIISVVTFSYVNIRKRLEAKIVKK